MSETPLAGGSTGPVWRRGDEVLRTAGPWTPAVHRLLAHCRAAGLTEVPEPRGVEGGREVLSYLPGEVPAYPLPAWVWRPEALVSSVELLRRYHEAAATADRSGPWRSPSQEPVEVVCHNDVAPYNIVYRDGRAVGLIDADYASPGPRLWDLAYLAYRIVPLTWDRADGFSDAERRQRLRLLCQTYGASARPEQLLPVVAERLVELAAFSERRAVELSRPELAEHAVGYRRDVGYVISWGA
ncbi:MAG: phosphotransferase [Actinomycetia bacterium]|nr:phosphotransferase [Actinomycetes bacterium]